MQFNQINNIDALKSDNFKNLEELNLFRNNILFTELQIKEILNFKKLKKLDIDAYKIKKSNLKETLVSKFNLINYSRL